MPNVDIPQRLVRQMLRFQKNRGRRMPRRMRLAVQRAVGENATVPVECMLKLIVTSLKKRPKERRARVDNLADKGVGGRDADVGAFARGACCPDADCDEHAYQLGADCDPSSDDEDDEGPPPPPSRLELLEQLQLLIDEVASAPPAPSAPPSRPAGDEEHMVKVKWGKRMRTVCKSAIGEDGALVGGCYHICANRRVSMQEFAPHAACKNTAFLAMAALAASRCSSRSRII